MVEGNKLDRPVSCTGQVPLLPMTKATTLSTKEQPGSPAFLLLRQAFYTLFNILCFFPSRLTKAASTLSSPHSSRVSFTLKVENGWQITTVVKLILPTVVLMDFTLLTDPLRVEVQICCIGKIILNIL